MQVNYWERFTSARIGRRRALTLTGGAAAAAAFLAACGGDDDDGSSTGSGGAGSRDTSGLLLKPTDQTSTRKRGGQLDVAANVATATLEQSLGGNGSVS